MPMRNNATNDDLSRTSVMICSVQVIDIDSGISGRVTSATGGEGKGQVLMATSLGEWAAAFAWHRPVPRLVSILLWATGLALVQPASPALAQGQGNVQVTARVLATEPSRAAWDNIRMVRRAPAGALFRVRGTESRTLAGADRLDRPRRIITIDFLQN
jgi:hypothetical protein